MPASRRHASPDDPAVFSARDALPGRRRGGWDGEDRFAHVRIAATRATPGSSPSVASRFPHGFSTKPADRDTGLHYYGHRWFDPVTGRGIRRDPIEEAGRVNLYESVGNHGVNGWDLLGWTDLSEELKCRSIERMIDGFLAIRPRGEYRHSQAGQHNHPTGRMWSGTMVIVECEDGYAWDASINTGGMRTRGSDVSGGGEENPEGDDNATPAGDSEMATERRGKMVLSIPMDQGVSRSNIKEQLGGTGGVRTGKPDRGTHGCLALNHPDE